MKVAVQYIPQLSNSTHLFQVRLKLLIITKMNIEEQQAPQEEIKVLEGPGVDMYLDFEQLSKNREKQFDKNFNKIAYYMELKKTQGLFEEFAEKLYEQILVLAFGGHRILLETIDKDDAINYAYNKIFEQGTENWVLKYLWKRYNWIRPIGLSGLYANIRRNEVYTHIEKEKIMKKIFKEDVEESNN